MAECSIASGEIGVETRRRFELVDVTGRVEDWLSAHGARDGVLTVFVPHTTAAILINEAEPGLMEDILSLMRELTRPGAGWMHNRIDNNAHAHLGNVLVGPSVSIPVAGGRPRLGTWQRIMLLEMDGPRRRRLVLTFIGALGP